MVSEKLSLISSFCITNAQINLRVESLISLYLTHLSFLLAIRKKYYRRLTDAESTGTIQWIKCELLQLNASATTPEETSLQQLYSFLQERTKQNYTTVQSG
jgi:hypothetical protein